MAPSSFLPQTKLAMVQPSRQPGRSRPAACSRGTLPVTRLTVVALSETKERVVGVFSPTANLVPLAAPSIPLWQPAAAVPAGALPIFFRVLGVGISSLTYWVLVGGWI